jgi:hypothetical protein
MTHGSTMMNSVVMMVMMVKASRSGRGAGKGVCWDTRDANDN